MDRRPFPPATRRRRHDGRRLLALVALLATTGCDVTGGARPRPGPPMPVPPPLRKQVLQGYMPFGSIGWVGNNRVIFSGQPIHSKPPAALYVWEQSRTPRQLLQDSPGGCTKNNIIIATQITRKGGYKRFQLQSPDFHKQEIPAIQATTKSKFDPASCSSITTPTILEGRSWEPLREGEGFLDFGPLNGPVSMRAVEHLASDHKTRHDTSIRMEWPMLPQVVHAAHDGSYLIYDLNQTPAQRQRWLQTDRRTIWRLNQQFLGEPLSVPAGTWVNPVGGTLAFLPARPGVLILSNNFARNRSPGGAGLYLLAPGKPAQRLERGLVQDAAVSPDGCRIAYGFRPRLDTGLPEGGPRLVVLDLCGTTATKS